MDFCIRTEFVRKDSAFSEKREVNAVTKPNKNYLRIGFVISLLIVIATICEHANTESILRTANGILLGLIRSSIYIGLFAAWRFSVRQRIVPKNTRRYLSAVAFFLILWMVIRTVKYYFVVDPNINRMEELFRQLAMRYEFSPDGLLPPEK